MNYSIIVRKENELNAGLDFTYFLKILSCIVLKQVKRNYIFNKTYFFGNTSIRFAKRAKT